MKSPTFHHHPAFTLLEALIVISIIATLAAIGLSGISKFRRSADKTGAMTSLRALQTANTIWASDHTGKYIPIYAFDDKSKALTEWWKTPEFISNLTGDPRPETWIQPVTLLDPAAFRAKGRFHNTILGSFAYMESNMPGGNFGQKNTSRAFSVSQVKNPARSAAFVTATDWILKYPARLAWTPGTTQDGYNPNGMIAFRHTGKAIATFYDGHIEIITPGDIRRFDSSGGILHPFWNAAAN